MSPSLIHRSVHDFTTVSGMERALALSNHSTMDCEDYQVFVADWKLDKCDELTSVDTINDSYAETQRLKVFLSYNALETPFPLDELAQDAKELLQVSSAVVGMMDLGCLVIQAQSGDCSFSEDEKTIPRSRSICAHTIQRRSECGVLVVPDIAKDGRFQGAYVNGMRFYAGAPIRSPEGAVLGVVSVWDKHPRPDGLTLQEQASLQQLADCVMAEILMA